MKSVLLGSIAAIVVAIAAYAILDTTFQQTAEQRHVTTGVRL